MEVVFLGTSSATPTVNRGLSAVAVVRKGETILLDCGEGTQFRMLEEQIPRRKLHRILITHLHGDHIFGLGGLISSLNLANREYPLHIHGPRGIARFVRFITGFPRPTRLGFEIELHEMPPGFEGEVCRTREYRVLAAPLDHTIPALGYRIQELDRPGRFDEAKAREMGVPFGPERRELLQGRPLTLPDGRVVQPEDVVGPPRPGCALAYCTDTAYAAGAVELARDADLLIHEATYGDEFQDMAEARKHSTIRQAAGVAREAGARRFAATHFSTRYDGPAMRKLEAEGREVFPDLVMAHDGLRLTL